MNKKNLDYTGYYTCVFPYISEINTRKVLTLIEETEEGAKSRLNRIIESIKEEGGMWRDNLFISYWNFLPFFYAFTGPVKRKINCKKMLT